MNLNGWDHLQQDISASLVRTSSALTSDLCICCL
uniref:Similar to ATMUS81 n=1 Tax=Arundo donax TaxID=35708 RepID=A0A0A9ELP0_ARUDO